MNFIKVNLPRIQIIRNYGVNAIRRNRGLLPRHAYSPLSETPEFSYLDGKGFAPLNKRQKMRYLRDIEFTKSIIEYMNQFEAAKKLSEKFESSL